MKISYNWLKEFLPELTLSAAEVAEQLTMGLFETNVANTIAIDPTTIVVKIVAVDPHPNADRLRLATIDTGRQTVQVVCGAPNIAVGQLVPYSPPGATVQDEDGSNFILKTVAIRGVESPGMLNSPRELALSNWHGGIYLLPATLPVGSKMSEHIPHDVVLEVELTPNRAHDCFSHRGLARELAAVLRLPMVEPDISSRSPKALPDWQLTIPADDPDTRAYYGSLLTEVSVADSPMWLQARLWAVGARPINNVVDVTNFVMFELGAPTHTYDADTLPGQIIGVRRAKVGEVVTTLDGQTQDLTATSLIVTSDDQPIALAGVMGGQATQVRADSSRLFLEAANFYPYTIYTTSQTHGLMTEGSQRWVKDVPVSLASEASARVIQLLEAVTGAKVTGGVARLPQDTHEVKIAFNPARPGKVAGIAVAAQQVQDALVRERCRVDTTKELWQVRPPQDRLDITGQHDLVEDVLRLIGYNSIPSVPPSHHVTGELPLTVRWREQIRDLLCSQGYTEMQNMSFADTQVPDSGQSSGATTALVVENPVAPESTELRRDLEPVLLGRVVANRSEFGKSGVAEDAVFEFGKVFSVGDGDHIEGVHETEQLVCVIVGERATLEYAHDLQQRIANTMGLPKHDRGAARVIDINTALGKKIRLPIAILSINFTAAVAVATEQPTFQVAAPVDTDVIYEPFSRYPAVYRDLSVATDSVVTVEAIQNIIERVGGELVVEVDLFDEYQAEDGTASLAFHIAYQATNRTLTGEEVATLHNTIVKSLHTELDVSIRE